jgi:hypothetical protein
MIIAFRRFGRLGNRLFMFSHLIAFAEKHRVDLLSPFFSEFRDNFPYFKNSFCAYTPEASSPEPRKPSLIGIRLAGSIGIIPTVRFWDDRDIVFDGADAFDPRVTTMIESPRAVFEGWKLRSHETILGIMPKIRAVFTPRGEILSLVEKRLSDARDRADIVIGVHIRWEDYRDTPRFFPVGVFLDRMKNVATLLKPSKVTFLVSSPEKLDAKDFPKDCVICTGGGPVLDMYTFASCDYIVGPASTYSGWASFYGGKPLFLMRGDLPFGDLSEAEIVRW